MLFCAKYNGSEVLTSGLRNPLTKAFYLFKPMLPPTFKLPNGAISNGQWAMGNHQTETVKISCHFKPILSFLL